MRKRELRIYPRVIDLLWDLLQSGYTGIFLFCFILYSVPFVGPSTMTVSGALAALSPSLNPLAVGGAVAISSTLAKTVHYYISFFARKVLREETVLRIERHSLRIGKWKFLPVFLAAVSPIPDEPVVILLGTMRYSPLRFALSFLAGKMIVTSIGAYFGQTITLSLETTMGGVSGIATSALITIILTVILLKVDFNRVYEGLRKRSGLVRSLLRVVRTRRFRST